MKALKNKLILLILIIAFFISKQLSFSQYTNKDKHKGAWTHQGHLPFVQAEILPLLQAWEQVILVKWFVSKSITI
jgi:hypothetical protein